MTFLQAGRSRTARGRATPPDAAGFSLVEVLLALALMALLMVGVLPLFTTSMTNNVQGNEVMEVTSRARGHLESMMVVPFDGESMTIPVGETELVARALWSDAGERWFTEAEFPVDEVPRYSRVTRVRQFNLSAIDVNDTELEPEEALAGGTPPSLVHVKEIEVRVNSGRPTLLNGMGRGKAVTLRALRAY
jgi:prepilin-type N-terminal cleavage/methylation domain-containing protein